MSRKPYFPFYVDDWLSGTRGLDDKQARFYVDCLALMWSRQDGLPVNRFRMAKLHGCSSRKSRRLTKELLAEGKLIILNRKIFNPRMAVELGVSAKFDPSLPEVTTKFAPSCEETTTKLDQNSEEKPKENNDPSRALENHIQNQNQNHKEEDSPPLPPSGGHVPMQSAAEMFPDQYADDLGVKFKSGCLTLFNGTRQFWLGEFGDDARELDLALLEIAPRIQPNNRLPAAAQAQSMLAERARTRRERGKRYDARVAQSSATNGNAPADPDKRNAEYAQLRELQKEIIDGCSGSADRPN